MNNIKKTMKAVLAAFSIVLLALILIFNATTASAEEPPDGVDSEIGTSSPDAPMNAGVIKSSGASDQRLLACKSWGATGACGKTSPTGLLSPGENTKTKFGWADADGVYVATGCVLRNTTGTLVSTGGKWFKISGFFGATFTYRHDC